MFDAGFSELVLLFVIGLLILGPERLPRVASQIGRWVGRARRTASQLRHQLEREIALNDIRRPPPPKPPPRDPPPGKHEASAAAGESVPASDAEAEPTSDAGDAAKEKSDADS
jgi:Tat protein translocase TatB subunit